LLSLFSNHLNVVKGGKPYQPTKNTSCCQSLRNANSNRYTLDIDVIHIFLYTSTARLFCRIGAQRNIAQLKRLVMLRCPKIIGR